MQTTWDRMNPWNVLGLAPASPPATATMIPSVGRAAGPAQGDSPKPWNPDNPLFWFAALALLTFGAIGAATSVRIGPVKAAVAAGKS